MPKRISDLKFVISDSRAWLLLQSGPGEAAFNMALDEALLAAAPRLGLPVLRCYSWTEPAASFGYFQKFVEVERLTRLRPLVRRPTGGGLVPHDADWTYSLAFPLAHKWSALRAAESYRRVHEWIQAAFTRLHVPTELSPCCRKDAPGQCFVGAEQFDLLWQGRKIAGAAQRRTRDGLLIQGSIQPPPGVMRTAWQDAFRAVAHEEWGVEWSARETEPTLLETARRLAQAKFARREFNERR